ncbi:hypothetical protein [Micromonospora sp. DT231]|uniref:hypothetical protein n=1 Tax=Micromonospora sp. DT231 TaxID=3416526 RepID=UPI003CF48450
MMSESASAKAYGFLYERRLSRALDEANRQPNDLVVVDPHSIIERIYRKHCHSPIDVQIAKITRSTVEAAAVSAPREGGIGMTRKPGQAVIIRVPFSGSPELVQADALAYIKDGHQIQALDNNSVAELRIEAVDRLTAAIISARVFCGPCWVLAERWNACQTPPGSSTRKRFAI